MTLKLPIYMDYHATTPCDPRVVEAMIPYFTTHFGNAASRNHSFGWEAEAAIDDAREQVAKLIGAKSGKEIIFTSGASESDNLAIKGVAHFYKEKGNHIITAKTEHKAVLDTTKRLELEGFEVTYLDVDKEGRVSPDDVRNAITDKTKIIVVANPNNPTGNFMAPEHFVRIAETGIPFVVDEAYVEYSGLGMSQVQLTKKYKNVLITRTLSKAYGLAGMRFGYAIGDKDVIGQISGSLLPWNVGTIPMWAALAAFEDQEGLAERVKFNNDAVTFISESLSVIPGFTVFPSKSNYILFDCGKTGKTGKEVLAYAETKGIILRGESKKYDSDGWFRVTIGSKEENELFVNTVLEFFGMKK